MKRLLIIILCVVSLGCPANKQQQIARAAADASTVLKGFQQGETATYNQGKLCEKSAAGDPMLLAGCITISDADHAFIQQSLITIAAGGKTTDNCIRTAGATADELACVNNLIAIVDKLNADGALHLKSFQAKQDFQLAMVGTRTALAVITTIVGGGK